MLAIENLLLDSLSLQIMVAIHVQEILATASIETQIIPIGTIQTVTIELVATLNQTIQESIHLENQLMVLLLTTVTENPIKETVTPIENHQPVSILDITPIENQ